MTTLHRREFLKSAGLAGLGWAASPLLNLAACGHAVAQTAGDFRALVCIVLSGGNDGFNTVLSTDAEQWKNYQAIRTQDPDSIALAPKGTSANARGASTVSRLGGVLPVGVRSATGGRSLDDIALHPSLAGMRNRIEAGRAAIIANVGSLVEPISKEQFFSGAGKRPLRLFSHNDQLNWWQSMGAEGAVRGWAGVMAESMVKENAWLSSVSIGSRWLLGSTQNLPTYVLPSRGVSGLPTTLFGSGQVVSALRTASTTSRGASLFAQDVAMVAKRSSDYSAVLASALPPSEDGVFGTTPTSRTSGSAAAYSQSTDPLLMNKNPVTGLSEYNELAGQLQMAARTLIAAKTLGLKRQVITVSLGGFDTHDEQIETQSALLAKLDHALSYFEGVLTKKGLFNEVTTFTISDFGRTLTSNGDGTDHGWGSHHFVMGGAVNGGSLYGRLPTLAKRDSSGGFESPDLIHNGIMLPSLSVDQYGATLGRWFGANDALLKTAFPYLDNFGVKNLGFMKT